MSNGTTSVVRFRVINRKYKTNYKPINLDLLLTKDDFDMQNQHWNAGLCAYSSFHKGYNNRENPKYPLLWKHLLPEDAEKKYYFNRKVYRLKPILEEVNSMTGTDHSFYCEISLKDFKADIKEIKEHQKMLRMKAAYEAANPVSEEPLPIEAAAAANVVETKSTDVVTNSTQNNVESLKINDKK
ncbi:MAG: hypothetical protein ACRC4M_03650 [Mycoplasma sp.]